MLNYGFIYLIIYFFVGILLFYFLKKSCGCNVLEGQGDDVVNELELTIYTDDDGNLIGEFISPIDWDNGEIISIYNDESEEYTYLNMSDYKEGDIVTYFIPEYQISTRRRQMQEFDGRGAISDRSDESDGILNRPRPDDPAVSGPRRGVRLVTWASLGNINMQTQLIRRRDPGRGGYGSDDQVDAAMEELRRSREGRHHIPADILDLPIPPMYPPIRTIPRREINQLECNWFTNPETEMMSGDPNSGAGGRQSLYYSARDRRQRRREGRPMRWEMQVRRL